MFAVDTCRSKPLLLCGCVDVGVASIDERLIVVADLPSPISSCADWWSGWSLLSRLSRSRCMSLLAAKECSTSQVTLFNEKRRTKPNHGTHPSSPQVQCCYVVAYVRVSLAVAAQTLSKSIAFRNYNPRLSPFSDEHVSTYHIWCLLS